jgi:hypothetical protein
MDQGKDLGYMRERERKRRKRKIGEKEAQELRHPSSLAGRSR